MSGAAIHEVLLDAGTSRRLETWSVRSSDLPSGSPLRVEGQPWKIEKTVLHGGRQEGVDRIRVENGALSFDVIPTRGMSLWEARCGDLRLGWDSPVKEVVHPQHVNLEERGGLGWLTGFGEWLGRCGLASNGAPGEDRVASNTGAIVPVDLTLHGKVCYLPAHRVEVTVEEGPPPEIGVRGVVDETMMFGTALRLESETSTRVGSKTIVLSDWIQNLAAVRQELQILYHVNFGAPLLEEGAVFEAPLARVTPRDARAAELGMSAWNTYGPPLAGYQEQVYFLKPLADAEGRTEVLLRNRAGDRGVSMSFSVKELPCLTVWKCTQAAADGYVTGIEPGTNFPNNRSFERAAGRVPVLEGGGRYGATLAITALSSREEVAAAAARVRRLQGETKTQVDTAPVAGISP
jgi:hypothetical protein